MKKFILIFIFLCLTHLKGFGQYGKVDSLLNSRLMLNKVDTSWINVTNLIAQEFLKRKKEKYAIGYATGYANEALRFATQIDYSLGIADALLTLGSIDFENPLKREKETIEKYKKALGIYEKEKDNERLAIALKTIADYYYNLFYLKEENNREALNYYLRYAKVTEKTGNKIQIAEAYIVLGNIYDELEESQKSNEYYLKAVNLKQQIEDQDIDNPHLFSRAKRFYELQIENQRILNYSVIGGLIFSLSLILLLFVNIRQIRKSKNLLQNQKDEISQQKDAIEAQSIELKNYTAEIATQRDKLSKQHSQLLIAKEEKDKANEELQTMVEHLEELVANRTKDLQITNEALTDVNYELDILIYRASHDFKGPVATLQGLSNLGKYECYGDEKAVDFFERIESTALKMDGMLEKLHQVSYLISKPLDFSLIDFEHILNEIKSNLVGLIASSHIQFDLEVENHINYFADSELMVIILENLIENAINFRTQKSDVIPLIQIKISKIDYHTLIIEVIDNGAGIQEEYLPKIFDMFFRGSEMSKGNGLGLYVVKKALERLNGDVKIHSKIDQFTIFQMNFPL